MGNERYTSPALSRDLAAAGLEQKVDGYFYCEDRGLVRLTRTERRREEWNAEDASSRYSFGDHIRAAHYVRALDLTDVLAEIEKRGATWLIEMADGMYCMTADLGKFSAVMGGPTAAEAAGLCLLALMDKETAADIDLSMRRSMDGERAKP